MDSESEEVRLLGLREPMRADESKKRRVQGQMEKTPQFFNAPDVATFGSRSVFDLPSPDGGTLRIMVDGLEGTGNLPRDASSSSALAGIAQALNIQTQFDAAAAMARMAIDTMKRLQPGEVEVEFGIELGGEAGVPLVTKGTAKANVKITLKWSNSAGAAHP